MPSVFATKIQQLEERFAAVAAARGDIDLPNFTPRESVDAVLIGMEPSLGRWAPTPESSITKIAAGFRNFIGHQKTSFCTTAPGALFRALARHGNELVAVHLLASPKLDRPIAEYLGGRGLEVEKVSWANNTVWVDKVQTRGFKGVREEVWNLQIDGYQVCEKWLKDRKCRTLSKDDISHY